MRLWGEWIVEYRGVLYPFQFLNEAFYFAARISDHRPVA